MQLVARQAGAERLQALVQRHGRLPQAGPGRLGSIGEGAQLHEDVGEGQIASWKRQRGSDQTLPRPSVLSCLNVDVANSLPSRHARVEHLAYLLNIFSENAA